MFHIFFLKNIGIPELQEVNPCFPTRNRMQWLSPWTWSVSNLLCIWYHRFRLFQNIGREHRGWFINYSSNSFQHHCTSKNKMLTYHSHICSYDSSLLMLVFVKLQRFILRIFTKKSGIQLVSQDDSTMFPRHTKTPLFLQCFFCMYFLLSFDFHER